MESFWRSWTDPRQQTATGSSWSLSIRVRNGSLRRRRKDMTAIAAPRSLLTVRLSHSLENALAFSREQGVLSYDLYVLPVPAGGKSNEEPRRLTNDEQIISAVDWTADSRNIVFSKDRSGNNGLWLIPVSGGRFQRLTFAGENAAG